jgi:hypothetical protein
VIIGQMMIACPHCGALVTHYSMTSGNTFGARMWTDGCMEAPMWTACPPIGICHRCENGYWLEDAREVARNAFGRIHKGPDGDPQEAQELVEPDEGDFYHLLRAGFATDRRRERILRTLAWHRSNDLLREGSTRRCKTRRQRQRPSRWPDLLPWLPEEALPPSPPVAQTEVRENLQKLAALLDDACEQDRLQKAEILRELGDFDAALRLLDGTTWPSLRQIADQIRHLCVARDVQARPLQGGGTA